MHDIWRSYDGATWVRVAVCVAVPVCVAVCVALRVLQRTTARFGCVLQCVLQWQWVLQWVSLCVLQGVCHIACCRECMAVHVGAFSSVCCSTSMCCSVCCSTSMHCSVCCTERVAFFDSTTWGCVAVCVTLAVSVAVCVVVCCSVCVALCVARSALQVTNPTRIVHECPYFAHMRHVSYLKESCLTWVHLLSRICRTHVCTMFVCCTHASSLIFEGVMSHLGASNES